MAENVIANSSREYSFVETKRHRPCLIFRGYRYVQDKIQNQTIYWRCEDRANCHGRAHQPIGNGSLPILTIKHNHPPMLDEIATINSMPRDGLFHQRRQFHKNTPDHQLHSQDDLSLSSALPTMTSPIKLENHHNRQLYAQHHPHNHGSIGKNLHLSEVITTAAAMNASHHNGIGLHRPGVVDPIEMNKLLSNITTSMSLPSKTIPTSPNMDYSSRLNHFSWEEIENRFLPVIFRNENGCLHRYTSKMFVENTLFQSESWQRHATLARSLPPLVSFPYTDNELKLFRLIVEWHLASFHFKTIPPSDCLIRYDDLLEFYGALRKLRNNVAGDRFNRSLAPPPPPPIPPPMPIPPPKQRASTNPNGLTQSFELPTMIGGVRMKTHLHQRPQHPPAKFYPPSPLHSTHPPNYLIRPNSDLITPFSGACTAHPFNYNSIPSSKSNIPSSAPSSNQWNEITLKSNDTMRSNVPKPMLPMNSISQTELNVRDKIIAPSKVSRTAIEVHQMPRDSKESGWVQINNVFVPYVVKFRMRDNDFAEKLPTRPPNTNSQREFFVPYEILIKCHIFSDQEFAFKKFLIKATQQDFDIFNSLITNINIFDEKAPEKTLLVNLYHVMIGLQKILYVKLLTTKQPRTQVNKYHAEVLNHKGGTLLMSGNKLVPYILQNNRYYVPLMYTYQSVPNVLSQAKRGARAPRQYEIDYLNLLLLYFSIESPPLTSDTLLVDAYNIKCSNYQAPVHFRTLMEHQQYERNRLMTNLVRASQMNNKSSMKTSASTTKSTVIGPMATKLVKYPPANVVVNPMIHHPSFYGLSSPSTSIKPLSSSPPSSSTHSSSVIVNPLLKPVPDTSETRPQITSPYPSIKSIKHDQHNLNAIVKAANISSNDWKISIRHIFNEFAFEIDYQKFVQWCQTNLLLPLISIDNEEKQIAEFNKDDDFYVYHRHLERCIALLKDLKRGTISMTLLPPSTNDLQSSTLVKSPLAGAKKRKTTIPTTRHASSMSEPASDIVLTSDPDESDPVLAEIDVRSPELITGDPNTPTLLIDTSDSVDMSDENQDESSGSVEKIDDESTSKACDVDSSFLIVESNEGDDGKILLDDTLPSCSSGYESAPALNIVDTNAPNHLSSDEENEDDETRSREYSSSCQSEQSLVPILSNVPSNIQANDTDDDEETKQLSQKKISITNSSSKSSTTNGHKTRQRDKHGKFRARSRSPTPRSIKKKRSTDEQLISANTITSDQIEQHLRTLSMPNSEQRRTRTRPIKTPTRLVEEISANYSSRVSEPDTNVFESMSSSSSTSTNYHSDFTRTNTTSSHDSSISLHQSCTYNVTMSDKPNKLGLTIKKILPR